MRVYVGNWKMKTSVNSVPKLIGASKSGYYSSRNRKPLKWQLKNVKIKEQIIETYNDSHQTCGAPKITKVLN